MNSFTFPWWAPLLTAVGGLAGGYLASDKKAKIALYTGGVLVPISMWGWNAYETIRIVDEAIAQREIYSGQTGQLT